MPPSTRGRGTISPPTKQQPPSKRTRKPSAKLIEQQEAWEDLDAETVEVTLDSDKPVSSHPRGLAGGANLGSLLHIISELKATISRQSKIIEDARTDLVKIKGEQRSLKN
ncbi:MAG: hypothetical protein LQ347_004775 [Umbilicaria vellea]|nr:MAG: hypothetical protein LQ347_004775 [Umbilicaria vellea]